MSWNGDSLTLTGQGSNYELRYEKLKSYNFDPNAEILYALEVLQK